LKFRQRRAKIGSNDQDKASRISCHAAQPECG
jgi:hypothetical protein